MWWTLSFFFQNKARIEKLKEELENANKHLFDHGRNVTNTTNHGLDRVADVLESLKDRATTEISEVN